MYQCLGGEQAHRQFIVREASSGHMRSHNDIHTSLLFSSSLALRSVEAWLAVPDHEALAARGEGIVDLAVRGHHLIYMLCHGLGLRVLDVLQHLVLGDGAVAQVPVVAVVVLPQGVVVALPGCSPRRVQLVLTHQRGQDLGVERTEGGESSRGRGEFASQGVCISGKECQNFESSAVTLQCMYC
eukprot:1160186-Pelagomonas_calceolata.AAC.1